MVSQDKRTLLVVFRRDLRVADNPIIHHIATSKELGYAYLLPVYVFPAHQTELSGFIQGGAENPHPEAKSRVGGYWRCGPHRATFIGQAVWDVKESLEALGSGLVIRVGDIVGAVGDLVKGLQQNDHSVGAIWMTSHEGTEEHDDQKAVSSLCEETGAQFKIWTDEKYFIDDRDIKGNIPAELPDVFTTYRKECEPLREKPRATFPAPEPGSLPKLPDMAAIPGQRPPFIIPETLDGLVEALVKPVASFIADVPKFPENAVSAHPFKGGETKALERLTHLIQSEGMKNYKDTRNGLIGTEFSTKLSAYLAQGCITSRQIHHALLGYENGTDPAFEIVDGYGAGENDGTAAIRFELLWRDYMRLCHMKFGLKLFQLEGFKGDGAGYSGDQKKTKWKTHSKERASADQNPGPERIAEILKRFNAGTTGMGLIDAAQRELLHTGYTSNRARQNVASFLAKHLGIDWRYGAEWYEMLLVDYDVSSNWANWQYVSGVGNDPRGELRIFNPVKQAFDYDKDGSYVRSWVPEVSNLAKLENVFQAWTASEEDLKAAGLAENVMVTDTIKRIEFSVDSKPPKPGKRPFFRRRGRGGGSGGGRGGGPESPVGSDGAAGASTAEGRAEERSISIPTSPRSPARGGDGGSQRPQQPMSYAPIVGSPHGGGPSHRGARGGSRGGGGGYLGQQQRGGYRGTQRGYYHGVVRGGGGYRGPGFHGAGRGHSHGPWDPQLRQVDG